MILPILAIAPSKHRGRGVFATEDIKATTVIEMSPVLVFSMEDRKKAEETVLYNYIFEWGEKHDQGALGLGYISIYNHSYHPNCSYQMNFDNDLMTITAIQDITAGEELFINYNADPEDQTPIWFEVE